VLNVKESENKWNPRQRALREGNDLLSSGGIMSLGNYAAAAATATISTKL